VTLKDHVCKLIWSYLVSDILERQHIIVM